MGKTMKIQTFEIYGNEVTMGFIKTIKLKKIGNKQHTCEDDWTWNRKGLTYTRAGGKEHGFMVLVGDKESDEEYSCSVLLTMATWSRLTRSVPGRP
jgi:hypothetical protein